MAKPTPMQLARINQLAKTPLTEDQVYVFNAKLIGDNEIPGRFQRVTPNFLTKMLGDVKDGVALLLDHSWANWGGPLTIPIGRTFDGSLQQDGSELALYADHYMVRGQNINGITTDDIISGIDAGTIFDTSIGYLTTKNICTLCGYDYFGGICTHWRGQVYDGQTCTVEQDDGELMENSLVFDGAYPGAGITAASKTANSQSESKSAWKLTEDSKSQARDGRVLFSYSKRSGLNEYVNQLEAKPERNEDMNELEQARNQLSTANSLLATVRTALKVNADGEIADAIGALSKKAKVGEQYATKVIEETCGAGVRALGDAFNVEAMKLSLNHLPVEEVEKIRDTYNAQAKNALGGGGQHTVTEQRELPADPTVNGNGDGNGGGSGEGDTVKDKLAKQREEARAMLHKNAPKFLKDGDR